jgi:hypothetical protein
MKHIYNIIRQHGLICQKRSRQNTGTNTQPQYRREFKTESGHQDATALQYGQVKNDAQGLANGWETALHVKQR